MKVLMVGAGALGGYFGARLLQTGRDVTFLLRSHRVKQLKATNGLQVKSVYGDIAITEPPYILATEITHHYDLIIVSCKAYDLDNCMESFAPAVGADTMILPMMNGMTHLEKLKKRFGVEQVLGGCCKISAVLDKRGQVIHLNNSHSFVFGELNGANTTRIQAVTEVLSNAGFEALCSENIVQKMWDKWVFIATAAGITCLMRAAICDIVKAGGTDLILDLLRECSAIAIYNGFSPDENEMAKNCTFLTDPDQTLMTSMLNDMENGRAIEGEAIIGDFLKFAPKEQKRCFPMLELVYVHLKSYDMRRQIMG